jgi:hypothetical protein
VQYRSHLASEWFLLDFHLHHPAQLLKGYGVKKPGYEHSRLEKLARGMPKRSQKCKERRQHVFFSNV